MLKLKRSAKRPCHFSEVCWVSVDRSKILISLQSHFCIWSCDLQEPDVRFSFPQDHAGSWAVETFLLLNSVWWANNKGQIQFYTLEYLSYRWLLVHRCCLVHHGTVSLFKLLAFIIHVTHFPVSALIVFTCDQSVIQHRCKSFLCQTNMDARENRFRWLWWIWDLAELIIPAFSYQILDCSILVPCNPSGGDVFLSREREKIQSLSLSALVLQEMGRREMWSLRISTDSKNRIYREGENCLWDSIPWGSPGSIAFWYLKALSCLLVVGVVGDAVFKQQTAPYRLFQEDEGKRVVCCQWTVEFLCQNDFFGSYFFHRNVRINDSLLTVEAFCQSFPLWTKTSPVNSAERKWFTKDWEMYPVCKWWKIEPSECQ